MDKQPHLPATAQAIPRADLRGYDLCDAAWWPCPTPDDELAFMVSISAHLLGYDQARSFWVQALIESDADGADCWKFVTWADGRRGVIRQSFETTPLGLFGCHALYLIAREVVKLRTGEYPGIPQCMQEFSDE